MSSSRAHRDQLPESEWNFFGPSIRPPLAWQMNHWLNYEYARSYRPIVQAVLQLRKQQPEPRETGQLSPRSAVPRFAAYLAGTHPEFPARPWLELTEKERRRRLQEAAAGFPDDPFEDDVINVHDAFLFTNQVALGDISLDPLRVEDQKFAVLEIDFTKGSKTIVNRFRQWLENRRQELVKKYENQYAQRHGLRISLAGHFISARGQGNVGQRNNKRQYETALKRLAGLRLLEHYTELASPYMCCAEQTQVKLGQPLFAEEPTAWNRCLDAMVLMRQFAVLWQNSFYPPFGLRLEDFRGTITAPRLAQIRGAPLWGKANAARPGLPELRLWRRLAPLRSYPHPDQGPGRRPPSAAGLPSQGGAATLHSAQRQPADRPPRLLPPGSP